jgi:amidase
MGGFGEYGQYDGIGLARLVRGKEVKPSELIEEGISRIERLNPQLNAIIHTAYDHARGASRDWDTKIERGEIDRATFCGVPFLLKDLVAECEGMPFEEGSRAVKGYVSKLDTELVRRQKAAGLIIVGKTNTPEFGCMATTEPVIQGPTANPWDPSLTPGGSSGGSTAAVAAGIVPMAHGTDGGGSIRIPASCCGLFGLKPTRGRNPHGPLFGDIASGIAAEHAMTRTVRDSAALLDATSGPDVGDPYQAPPKERPFLEELGRDPGCLKIGLLTSVPEGWHEKPEIHPDCEDAVNDAARLCESLGHVVELVAPDELSHPNIAQTCGSVFCCYVGHAVKYWERELGKTIGQDDLEPLTWAMYQLGLSLTGADYLFTVEEIQRFSRNISRWYVEGGYDLLLSPTMTIPPVKLVDYHAMPDGPQKQREVSLAFVAFTRIQNSTGQPAMSVPLFWNQNDVPIGVQFAGRYGDEATLFRLAAQLEEARPWAQRRPKVHCANQ